jgi:hypothetical protein
MCAEICRLAARHSITFVVVYCCLPSRAWSCHPMPPEYPRPPPTPSHAPHAILSLIPPPLPNPHSTHLGIQVGQQIVGHERKAAAARRRARGGRQGHHVARGQVGGGAHARGERLQGAAWGDDGVGGWVWEGWVGEEQGVKWGDTKSRVAGAS